MSPKAKIPEKAIRRVDRSPMNGHVWCVELECGHEEWLYQKPRRKSLPCARCNAMSEAPSDGK